MLSKKIIIESYVKIITDSLIMMDNSAIVTNSPNVKNILYNSLNIVIHVFTLAVSNDSTLDNLFLYCQKAGFCYVEYIEQMTKTNLLELDNATISSFVYKQSLSGFKPKNNLIRPADSDSSWSTTVEDIISSPERANLNIQRFKPSASPSTFQYDDLLHIMKHVTHTLLAWTNNGPSKYEISLKAKIAICDVYLANYIKLLYNLKTHSPENYCDLMDIVRQKTCMDENIFFAFLGEYYNMLYHLKKQNKLLTNRELEDLILGWSVNDLFEIGDEKKVRKFTKQLLVMS